MKPPAELAAALAEAPDLGPDGVWRIAGVPGRSVSYPADASAAFAAVEDRSWWFGHRREAVLRVLRRFPPSGTVWDIGGGNGFMARALINAGYPAVLVEAGGEACLQALRRGVAPVIQSAFEDLPLRPGSLSAAGLFDVLEHVRDRAAFLRRVREALSGGRPGRLYLTVPAHAWLWSGVDDWSGHLLRFSRGRLIEELKAAGFRVAFETFFFSWLSPSIALGRTAPDRISRLLGRPSAGRAGRVAAAGSSVPGLARLWAGELGRIERGRRIVHGASLLAVGET